MAKRINRGVDSLPQPWKDKLKAAYIAKRFMECFDGKIKLTPLQVRAGEILFKRLEPELSRTVIANAEGETFKTSGGDLSPALKKAICDEIQSKY